MNRIKYLGISEEEIIEWNEEKKEVEYKTVKRHAYTDGIKTVYGETKQEAGSHFGVPVGNWN